MPTMDPETIGGIYTGFTSYLELFCVPPYSRNSVVAYLKMIVHANNACGSEIADDEKDVVAI